MYIRQIGWACTGFESSALGGDGVGDDDCSWAYDGCRNKAWHGKDIDYPASTSTIDGEGQAGIWKADDVIGCAIEFITTTVSTTAVATAATGRKKGSKGKKSATASTPAVEETAQTKEINEVIVTYYKNGINLGTAFRFPTASTASTDVRYFFPALSVDADQRVRVNVGLTPFVHAYDVGGGIEAVSKALLTTPISVPVISTSSDARGSSSSDAASVSVEKHLLTGTPTADTNNSTSNNTTATAAITYPLLDLESPDYNTLEALQLLPAERLKQELLCRGLKCGGTVTERAARLWAVRGLSDGDIPAKLKATTNTTATNTK